MKISIKIIFNLIIIIFMSFNGYAYDENDLQKLLATNSCVKCDLSGADLRKAELSNANLQGANLNKANLWRANLENANLDGCSLEDANLRRLI